MIAPWQMQEWPSSSGAAGTLRVLSPDRQSSCKDADRDKHDSAAFTAASPCRRQQEQGQISTLAINTMASVGRDIGTRSHPQAGAWACCRCQLTYIVANETLRVEFGFWL